jgi:hypothetical protein
MKRRAKKYRPGIDDPPQPAAVTRVVYWVAASALRLLAILIKPRRPR